MKLSIIIPVYNEEKTITEILDKVSNIKLSLERELIVVDDYSKDKTLEILEKRKDITLIKHEKNLGKGAAVRSGIKNSKGDIVVVQDADLEYDPNDYSKLLQPILNNEVSIVYGSRFLNKKFKIFGKDKTILPSHLIGNKLLTLITTILFQKKLTNMETCYKVFKKDVLKNIILKSNRFEIEPEITAKFLKSKYEIKEIPINYHPRDFSEGKKITVKDGILAFFYLIKYRFFN